MKLKKAQLKKLRKEFREAVFARDCGCVMCGDDNEYDPENIQYDAHHIMNRKEMPADGYAVENGIMLCPECHIIAEDTYFGRKANYNVAYLPNSLYTYIHSSYSIADEKCKQLEKKHNNEH
jgi:5-methylcytosine-specific restriction endonuclease McrA